jgi:uncharacterized alpha-E superfamily protein
MLSRTAENLYWLARYVERAEYIARTIDATLRVTALPAAYIGKTNEWESALLTAGVSASFYEVYQEANEQNVVEYLAFSPSNPSSIKNCIEAARLNSRSVRTALTSEMWDTINGSWIELQEVWNKGTASREELARFLRFVQENEDDIGMRLGPQATIRRRALDTVAIAARLPRVTAVVPLLPPLDAVTAR